MRSILPDGRFPSVIASAAALAALAACAPAPPVPAPAASLRPADPLPSATRGVTGAADPQHNSLAAERAACDRLAAPGTAVALPAAEAAAPTLAVDARHDLAIGAEGGYARFTVPRAGEWSVFTDADLLLFVRAPSGEIVFEAEDPGGSAVCGAIARQRVYLLEPGRTYGLELDTYPKGPLRLVIGETHPGGAPAP